MKITAAEQSQSGRDWLASLPERTQAMSQKWGIQVELGEAEAGFNAIVRQATRNGEPCVLKLDDAHRISPESLIEIPQVSPRRSGCRC